VLLRRGGGSPRRARAAAQEAPKTARIGFIVTGEAWARRDFDARCGCPTFISPTFIVNSPRLCCRLRRSVYSN
jgi:hypothetical protein